MAFPSRNMSIMTTKAANGRLAELIDQHDDVRALYAGDWIRYRSS
jgi:hypothetical protein